MTPESVQAMIDQALLRNSTNGDGSHSSHEDNRRNVQTARPYFYADFMKCQPLNFKGTEGVVGLTRWIKKMESLFNISCYAIENHVKFATCTLLGATLAWWNGQIRTLGPDAYSITWEVLKKKMMDRWAVFYHLVVRSHIGGEYVFPFLNLCAKLRIRYKFIALDTPTRELLKEKNHALEDMVNAMFLSPGLSHAMWGKAII
ncbi:hypothetical protein Tco_0412950 [Tanacetum coccineum]